MTTPSFFDNLKKSFETVPIDTQNDNAIATSDFLEATESLCTLFGMIYCRFHAADSQSA